MNFKYGDEASFFKILSNDFDDYLPLPPAFAEKYLEKDNNKRGAVILKNKSAVEWSVIYLKIKDKYYFMDGWIKFMRDNHLQICDLLVFSLLSPPPNSIFQVVVYAPNGCFKHPICSSDLPFEATKEHMSINKSLELVKSFKSDKPFYSVTMKLSYLRAWGLYVPITFLRRYLLSNDEMSVNCVLEVSDGRKWGPIICRDYKTCGRLSGPNWKKFREDNQLGLGDVCVLELMNEMEKVLKVTVFKNSV